MNIFERTLRLLTENPPPLDWDLKTFDASFVKQLKYAKERAKVIGTGSSRVAFIIDYQGRETVLKIAKNRKGLAQNEKEADYSLYRMYPDITINMIDYDEEHDQPTWIHFEKADKLTKRDFERIEGFSFDDFCKLLNQFRLNNDARLQRLNYNVTRDMNQSTVELIKDSELYNDVTDMSVNYDLSVGDFTTLRNWGLYNDKPVIIDLGFDSQVFKLYYKR